MSLIRVHTCSACSPVSCEAFFCACTSPNSNDHTDMYDARRLQLLLHHVEPSYTICV